MIVYNEFFTITISLLPAVVSPILVYAIYISVNINEFTTANISVEPFW